VVIPSACDGYFNIVTDHEMVHNEACYDFSTVKESKSPAGANYLRGVVARQQALFASLNTSALRLLYLQARSFWNDQAWNLTLVTASFIKLLHWIIPGALLLLASATSQRHSGSERAATYI
jgi:hypothetical protein